MIDVNTTEVQSALHTLQNHPFTLASLSGREKFHTGLIAYAIRQSPVFREGLGFGNDQDLDVQVEFERVDLAVFASNHPTGIASGPPANRKFGAEVKMKATLRSHQIPLIHSKFFQDVALISPTEPLAEELPPPARWIHLLHDVPKWIVPDHFGEGRSLMALWKGYLENLATIVDAVVGSREGVCRLNRKQLAPTRCLNIFDSIRYGIVARQTLATDTLDLTFRHGAAVGGMVWIGPRLDNTHGNGLLDLTLRLRNGPRNSPRWIALQWQGTALRVYIHAPEMKKTRSREPLLAEMAEAVAPLVGAGATSKIGRSGAGQSVTIAGWDVYGDLSGKGHTIARIATALQGFAGRVEALR